ncbi:MAG: gamma-glutamylputrescine oxidase [Saprospiraceae bacterium]|jgi:gamma-glutamylputrescine oxidase
MPNLSFWEKETFFKDIDYAIVGSGIVGLNAAITLKEKYPRRKVVIFERGALPIGASTRNAGFACFGSLTELLDDLNQQSEDEVMALVEKRWQGLERLRERCGDAALDYKAFGGMEIFREEEKAIHQDCVEKMPWFNDRIQKITENPETYLRADNRLSQYGFAGVKNLILNQEEGQIHTGQMMQRLLQIAQGLGVLIFNGIEIKEVQEDRNSPLLIAENNWEISVGKVLIAVNGFAKKLLPEVQLQPARNQVVITNPIENLPFSGCFHYDCGYFYFRNVGKRVLLGGGRNLAKKAEETTSFGETKLIQEALQRLLKEVILPNQPFEIEHKWSGILGVGESKNPIIKKISENVGISVRLGGMGVAMGSLIGEEGANLF